MTEYPNPIVVAFQTYYPFMWIGRKEQIDLPNQQVKLAIFFNTKTKGKRVYCK